MIKELKKELSALSGVDFFNPKFREVFKRYFPNDNEEVTAEEERLNEMVEEPVVEATEEVVEQKDEEIIEDTQLTEEQSVDEVVEDKVEEVAEEVNEPINEDPKAEEVAEVVEDKVETPIDDHKELIDAKVELELVKSGVREDRLEPAKRLFMAEIKTMEDIDKVKELIKQYPEWLNDSKPLAQPIGMVLDNAGDGLTAEQKKLKSMGIDPR